MARSSFGRSLARSCLWLCLGSLACTVEPAALDAGRAGASPSPPHPAVDRRPAFIDAPEGHVDDVVREALATAQADERRLVIYVGAVWCEPCQAFHHAVERGELDQALAGVRFLEFDSDHDGERLQAAGYGGRYIPRFVLPLPEGRASKQRIEGGIKGEGAVAHLMNRLTPLLTPPR